MTDSFEKKMNGMYPVENGLSCFADLETYQLYNKEVSTYNKADTSNNYYTDKLEKLFKENKTLLDIYTHHFNKVYYEMIVRE